MALPLDEQRTRESRRAAAAAAPVGGIVYGTLLNTKTEIAALGPALSATPYNAPPKAPVLYIKPPGTWRLYAGTVPLPDGEERVEFSATLGIVIGRTATRVTEAEALDYVLGYRAAIDVSLPQENYYRPSVRQRCRDGFLPLAPGITAREGVADPDSLLIRTLLNGREVGRFSTGDLVRPMARLIADVSDFMTLCEGDMLLIGLTPERPLARLGDRIAASIAGIADLEARIEREVAP